MDKLINASKILLEYYFGHWYYVLRIFPGLIYLLIPIILSFPTLITYVDNLLGILIVVAILVITFFCQQFSIVLSENKYRKLETENEELRREINDLTLTLESLPEDYIRIFFHELNLGDQDRISIYVYDEKYFTIVGRWSPTPNLKKKGREKYPLDEGFISKAWNGQTKNNKSYFHKNQLSDPETNEFQYIKEIQAATDIPEETIKSLSMKSRSYYVRSIKEEMSGSSIGVLVIESLKSSFSSPGVTEMDKRVEDRLLKFLSKLLDINTR